MGGNRQIRPKSIFCKACNIGFTSMQSLNDHQHTKKCPLYKPRLDKDGEVIEFKCEYCGKTFQRKKCLRRHQIETECEKKIHKPPVAEIFKCTKFNSTFKKQKLYEQHTEAKCQLQIKILQNQEELMRLTTEEERLHLKCVPCNKSFLTNGCLRRHKTSKKCNLRRSIMKLPTYKCKRCSRFFYSESGFWYHITKSFCRLGFNNLIKPGQKLITPKQKNYEGPETLKVRFFCRWCCRNFPLQSDMVKHMQLVHKKKIPQDQITPACKDTYNVDPARPLIYCCYVCLERFPQVIGVALNITSCEKKIGVSSEGFVPIVNR